MHLLAAPAWMLALLLATTRTAALRSSPINAARPPEIQLARRTAPAHLPPILPDSDAWASPRDAPHRLPALRPLLLRRTRPPRFSLTLARVTSFEEQVVLATALVNNHVACHAAAFHLAQLHHSCQAISFYEQHRNEILKRINESLAAADSITRRRGDLDRRLQAAMSRMRAVAQALWEMKKVPSVPFSHVPATPLSGHSTKP